MMRERKKYFKNNWLLAPLEWIVLTKVFYGFIAVFKIQERKFYANTLNLRELIANTIIRALVVGKERMYALSLTGLAAFFLLTVCFIVNLQASLENGDTKIYPALSITSGGQASSGGAFTLSGGSIGGLTDSTESMAADNFTMNAGPILAGVVLDISKQNLSTAHCYPVPFKPAIGHNRIRFTGLTRTTQIMIYALSGIIIKTIYKSDGNDFIDWDVKNNKGEPVFSGVYFYVVKDALETKTGKLMIIR